MFRFFLLLLVVAMLVATQHAEAQQRSACDRLVDAMRGNGTSQVLSTVRNYFTGPVGARVVKGSTTELGGLANVSSPILGLFWRNATYKYAALSAGELSTLINKVGTFIGNGLGCSVPTFPVYNITGDIAVMRGKLNITKDHMAYFVERVRVSCVEFGMPTLDINNVLLPYLNSFNRCGGKEICNHDSCDVVPLPTDWACAARLQAMKIQSVIQNATDLAVQAATDPDVSSSTMTKIGIITGSATLGGTATAALVSWLVHKFCMAKKV